MNRNDGDTDEEQSSFSKENERITSYTRIVYKVTENLKRTLYCIIIICDTAISGMGVGMEWPLANE